MKRLFLIYPVIVSAIVLLFTTACKKEEPATKPSLSTTPVTNITTATATSGGTIANDGGASITANGVCWGATDNPTINDSKTADGISSGQFVSNLAGLTGGTTYHVRAYATNSVGTAYGSDVSFLTLGQAPSGVTLAASNISATGGTLNGTVNPNFLSTTVSFEYGTTTSYGQTAAVAASPVNGNSIVNVNADISGLTAGTVYHFRLKIVNSLGTVYGADMSFTTLGQVPTGTTQPATNITGTGATLNGIVNANYLSTTVTFEYGTTTSYGISATATQSPVSGNTDTNVSASVTGLTLGATYHFRVKGVNSLGTLNGNDLSFTTLNVPTQTTKTPSNVTYNAAKSGGNITSDGGAAVTARGVCWSTSGNPTIALTTKTSDGTGIGIFSSSITGLTPNTTYYIRAYATNSVGTSYGNQVTLTTTVAPPTNGLIAYYPFNGNANDVSGNGHTGSVNGATLTVDRFNSNNSSYVFNGVDNFINLGNLGGYSSHTFAGWFKIEGQQNSWGVLVSKLYNDLYIFQNSEVRIDPDDGTGYKMSSQVGSGTDWEGEVINNSIEPTIWHHFVFMYDDNVKSIKVYIDNQLVSTVVVTGYVDVATTPTYIGARPYWNGPTVFFFNGKIDDVRIYNRALNAQEVNALFHEGGW
jgi:hypothetical protein